MAKAIKIDIPPLPPQYRVTLDLDQNEAEMLLGILGKFSGGGSTSPIYDALYNSGVPQGKWTVESTYTRDNLGTLFARKT